MLCNNPDRKHRVPSVETEFDKSICPPFHVFRRSTIIKNDESVRAGKKPLHETEPHFNLVLFAYVNVEAGVFFAKTEESLVLKKGGAYEDNVCEFEAERPRSLPNNEARFARLCRTNDESIERDVCRIHLALYFVSPRKVEFAMLI